MSVDGNLGQIFADHLPKADWQAIETMTNRGVPDRNGCYRGVEAWIENKRTQGWAVTFQLGQVAWIERRLRAGGRVFVAVRQMANPSPRLPSGRDELWLYHGSQARDLSRLGLGDVRPLLRAKGGPKSWPWDDIRITLFGQ